jgi:hypothetical protein
MQKSIDEELTESLSESMIHKPGSLYAIDQISDEETETPYTYCVNSSATPPPNIRAFLALLHHLQTVHGVKVVKRFYLNLEVDSVATAAKGLFKYHNFCHHTYQFFNEDTWESFAQKNQNVPDFPQIHAHLEQKHTNSFTPSQLKCLHRLSTKVLTIYHLSLNCDDT